MATNYDAVDLDWSWDGDLLLDSDSDLKDTSDDHIRSLVNEIGTALKSDLEDWRDNPEVGAGTGDFVGEPNDRNTANRLKVRVENALLNIVRAQDVSVRVVPFHIHKVALLITVQAMPSVKNSLSAFQSVNITFIFDYQEKGLYVPTSSMDHFYKVRDEV